MAAEKAPVSRTRSIAARSFTQSESRPLDNLCFPTAVISCSYMVHETRTELTRYLNPPRCRPYEHQGTNEERAEEEALRDAWFRMLKSGLELNSDSGPE